MRRLLFVVLFAGAAVMVVRPGAVSACSADETFDAVAASDVIVGGRVIGYNELPSPDPRLPFVPVALDITIIDVWKGATAPDDRIVNAASLQVLPIEMGAVVRRWVGGAGACGALDEDPTGLYAVFGLMRQPDGVLRTNRLTTFYLNARPYDRARLPRLSSRLGLPVAGSAGAGGDGRFGILTTAALIGGAVLIGLGAACGSGGAATVRRGRRPRGS